MSKRGRKVDDTPYHRSLGAKIRSLRLGWCEYNKINAWIRIGDYKNGCWLFDFCPFEMKLPATKGYLSTYRNLRDLSQSELESLIESSADLKRIKKVHRIFSLIVNDEGTVICEGM